MHPPKIMVQDFWLKAREAFGRGNAFTPIIQSVPLTNTEKVKGEPDTSCRQLTSSDYTHTRRAIAQKVGDDAYKIHEYHLFTRGFSTREMESPLAFSDRTLLTTAIFKRDEAADYVTRWEAEQTGAQKLNKQEPAPEPAKTPFHPSHFMHPAAA